VARATCKNKNNRVIVRVVPIVVAPRATTSRLNFDNFFTLLTENDEKISSDRPGAHLNEREKQ